MKRREKRECQILQKVGYVIYIHIIQFQKKSRKIYGTPKAQTKIDHKLIYSTKGSKERCSKNNKKNLDLKLQGIQ